MFVSRNGSFFGFTQRAQPRLLISRNARGEKTLFTLCSWCEPLYRM